MSAPAIKADGPGAVTRRAGGLRARLPRLVPHAVALRGLVRREPAIVVACYVLAAIGVTALLWKHPAARIVAGNPGDPDQSAWWLRYAAQSVAHWRLPALITTGMNAPVGVSAMWNPSLLLPGVVLSPVTLAFGPQVSLNVLLVLGFAGSATSLYWVLRQWGIGPVAAACGGLAYGFSPALTQASIGHYDLQFAVFPPLIAHFAARLITGRGGREKAPDLRRAAPRGAASASERAPGADEAHLGAPPKGAPRNEGASTAELYGTADGPRGSGGAGGWFVPPVKYGIGLGVTAALQLMTAEELLFNTALAIAVGLMVAALSRRSADPPSFAAPPSIDEVLGVASGLLVAGGVFIMIAGYPLWTQFTGPLAQHGTPYLPDFYKNDLEGLIQPSRLQFIHSQASAAFADRYQGNLSEYLGYLGWPLLLVLVWAAGAMWRLLAARVLAVTFLVMEVFALGGTLLFGGHVHQWLKLPWYYLQSLPLASSAVVDRFSIVADGCAAALLALLIDEAWRASAQARRRVAARVAIALATAVVVVPLLPAPLPTSTVASVPPGWAPVLTALHLRDGASVLAVPVPTATFTTPLRWEADTGQPQSMVGGYFIGPIWNGAAYVGGPGLDKVPQFLNWLWLESGPGPVNPAGVQTTTTVASAATAATWIEGTGVSAVVAVTSTDSPLAAYLTVILGPPVAQSGDVLGWRVGLVR